MLAVSTQKERAASGWTKKSEKNEFCRAAAGVMQTRLYTMASERVQAFKKAQVTAGSNALVVVNRKLALIEKRFGPQASEMRASRSQADASAREQGRAAGRRINIPSGRPLASSDTKRLT